MRALAATALASSALLVLGGCAAFGDDTAAGGDGGSSAEVALPASQTESLVENLPDDQSLDRPAVLDTDEAAPTNRWYSALVFNEDSLPVFPMPTSARLTGSGVALGVPSPTANATVVAAPAIDDLVLEMGADARRIVGAGELDVTVALDAGDTELAQVTLVRGAPATTIDASSSMTLTLPSAAMAAGDGAVISGSTSDWLIELVGGTVDDGATSLELSEGDRVLVTPVPDGADAASLTGAGAPVDPEVGYSVNGGSARTTISYPEGDVLVAVTPEQADGLVQRGLECDLGSWVSVMGELELCRGDQLAWDVATIEPTASLDVASLDADAQAELAETLAEDAQNLEFPTDSYYGGKALARAATLLEIARGLGEDDIAESLQSTLAEKLRTWLGADGCEGRATECLTADTSLGGVVAREASFGADEFNDHHFHYGYFFYAAAVAASDDEQLRDDISDGVTLLAADVASGETSASFPTRRVFDAYVGHSWASGFSPFADGNNQESSSEAVTAWNGLALWAQVAGDDALETEATWMLSTETAAANALYLAPDLSQPQFEGYTSSFVSLVWDGKIESATWFSAEPSAKLGIELLPMPASMLQSIDRDAERITTQLDEASAGGAVADASTFADYLLIYQGFAGAEDAQSALEAARELPDDKIDDGNTRTAMLAWLHVLAAGG